MKKSINTKDIIIVVLCITIIFLGIGFIFLSVNFTELKNTNIDSLMENVLGNDLIQHERFEKFLNKNKRGIDQYY